MDNYQREVVKRFAVGSERSRGSDAGGSSALSLLCLGLDPPHHEHELDELDLPTVAQRQ